MQIMIMDLQTLTLPFVQQLLTHLDTGVMKASVSLSIFINLLHFTPNTCCGNLTYSEISRTCFACLDVSYDITE